MEENIEELQRYVPNVHFEQIPIKNLVSDQNYQRNLSLRHVEKAAANFDLYQINPVKVSRRNGINYVFNGQHTIEIVALVSDSRETPVWCMIYDDLNYTQEADIFANQMKYVKPLLPYEIFMANIEAGSEKELIIKDLVESYDLSITSSSHPGGICAVSTLVNIYDKYGFHTLDRVLRLCVATWEGAPMSFSSNMLNAVARLDNAFGDKMSDTTFKERVGRVSVREIGRQARERRGGSLGFAEAILIAYNKKSKHPLRMDTLYAHKTPRGKRRILKHQKIPMYSKMIWLMDSSLFLRKKPKKIWLCWNNLRAYILTLISVPSKKRITIISFPCTITLSKTICPSSGSIFVRGGCNVNSIICSARSFSNGFPSFFFFSHFGRYCSLSTTIWFHAVINPLSRFSCGRFSLAHPFTP